MRTLTVLQRKNAQSMFTFVLFEIIFLRWVASTSAPVTGGVCKAPETTPKKPATTNDDEEDIDLFGDDDEQVCCSWTIVNSCDLLPPVL
jgi:hypothetical protein